MSNLSSFYDSMRGNTLRKYVRANNISLKRKNNSLLPCNPKFSFKY